MSKAVSWGSVLLFLRKSVFEDTEVYIKDEYQKVIDLSYYPKGIYMLQIENKKGKINKKVIRQ